MAAIFEQLGLNQTFFIQFGIFFGLYLLLSRVYFSPFLKLFQMRNKRIVEDRKSAEDLMAQADARFSEYRARLTEERLKAKQELDAVLTQLKKEEASLLQSARTEAKKVTQEAAQRLESQRDLIQKQLTKDVEVLADELANKILARRG